MKNTITLKLLILSLFTFLSLQGITQAWEYMEPMPTARALTTASELDGKIYVIGGTFSKTSPATAVVEVYDPITNTWDTTAPDLPVPLCGASSCVVDGKIYVIGGRTAYNGPPVQSVYFYDPISDSWESKNDISSPRSWLTTSVLNDNIYAMGGYGNWGEVTMDSVMMYDYSLNSWVAETNMPTPKAFLTSQVLDGKIYAMGGMHLEIPRSTVEVFDTQTGWTIIDDMPGTKWGHGSGQIDGSIYTFGGIDLVGSLSGTWKFDPSSGWSDLEIVMPEQVLEFGYVVAKDACGRECLYAIGGAYLDFSIDGSGPLVSNTTLKLSTSQHTEVAGGPVSGKWEYKCSPYLITGDIWVPDGETLIIEPGVNVIFAEHYRFDIHGQLLAEGSKNAIITLTAQDSVTAWNGLRFFEIPITNDTSKLIYCKVQYGFPAGPTVLDRSGGGIAAQSINKLVIEDCEITGNRIEGDGTWGAGIAIDGCSPRITRNLIANNNALLGHGGGIAIVQGSSPIVTNNIIFNNTAFGGGGISTVLCNPVFINNTITGNSADHGGGLDIIASLPTFINTIIHGNVASEAGNQVHIADNSTNNFLANFLYCDIEGGLNAFAYYPGPPSIYPGRYENNIDEEPEFIDNTSDFNLAETSECIGAGIDTILVFKWNFWVPPIDFYGEPRPNPFGSSPDIGAIENELGIPVGINELELSKVFFSLLNYPNPFYSTTTISYKLNNPGKVTIKIFNLAGKEVQTIFEGFQHTGANEIEWEANGLTPGVYFYRLQTDKSIATGKCILQR